MKKISQEQIESVLKAVYSTNITAQNFDAIKDFLLKLPDVEEKIEEVEVKEENGTSND